MRRRRYKRPLAPDKLGKRRRLVQAQPTQRAWLFLPLNLPCQRLSCHTTRRRGAPALSPLAARTQRRQFLPFFYSFLIFFFLFHSLVFVDGQEKKLKSKKKSHFFSRNQVGTRRAFGPELCTRLRAWAMHQCRCCCRPATTTTRRLHRQIAEMWKYLWKKCLVRCEFQRLLIVSGIFIDRHFYISSFIIRLCVILQVVIFSKLKRTKELR